MKNLIFNKLTLTLILLISIVACFSSSDDKYECKDCVDTPEANPAYDNTNQGVYKGVLTGSAGTFAIYIDNGDGKTVLKWEFEGDSGEINGIVADNGGSYTYTFTLGNVSLALEIQTDGTINSATFSYNGVEKKITVFKETSTSLVKCYKGSYSGDDSSGTWNLIVKGENSSEGVYYESVDEWGIISGNINENSVSLNIYEELDTNTKIGTAVGEFSGDTVSGSWVTDTENGSWKGKRYR